MDFILELIVTASLDGLDERVDEWLKAEAEDHAAKQAAFNNPVDFIRNVIVVVGLLGMWVVCPLLLIFT